ncbi:MAG: type II secretion system F family protein [Candidatus Thermoplasmatota archaeon]|nr:type II secretion system F family protein [Candidatus Thermoplasmatota archaeon]
MARKKPKIRVDLELPKDDKTQDTFLAILMIGVLLGLSCLGFWITNSDLVFEPANGNPMFVNLVCQDQFDPQDINGPTYFQNESCPLTHEKAQTERWADSWNRVTPPGLAKTFYVPGMNQMQLIDDDGHRIPHPQQPMTLTVNAQAANDYRYVVVISHQDEGTNNETKELELACFANDGSCSTSIDHAKPEGRYKITLDFKPTKRTNTRIGELLVTDEASGYSTYSLSGPDVRSNFTEGDAVFNANFQELGRVISATSSPHQITISSSTDSVPPTAGEVLYRYDRGNHMIQVFNFNIEVESYDGIPENMNNNSLWLGPELSLGPLKLRPMMFANFFGLGFLLMVYPAAVYSDRQMQKIEAMEDKFPDFLRDLAEYWKGGLSMTLAVRTLANSEYGALNAEVKKMSDQLSWGIAFEDVLVMFADRVGTPLVKRAVSLVGEANKAGGKISDILVTAANDSREIQFLKGERYRAIGSYIAVIWVSFMVFIGVIVVLSKVFIPAIASSNSGGESETIGNMQINAVDPLFFLVVFFYGVCAQALGNGAMAGLMATGRLATGMKQAGMMLIICIVLFNLVAFDPSLIGVPAQEGLKPDIGFIPIIG